MWQKFFDEYAPRYMSECFTQNTLAEVDFLVEAMHLVPGGTDSGSGLRHGPAQRGTGPARVRCDWSGRLGRKLESENAGLG